jgi:hypothetical protein
MDKTKQHITSVVVLSVVSSMIFNCPILGDQSRELDLKEAITDLQLQPHLDDIWTYIWNGGAFSSKQVYCFIQGSHQAPPLFKWMWASKVQNKHKFFFWLFLKDIINTRNLLHRKNMFLPSYISVLCVENVEEDVRHLFFCAPSVMLVGPI